MGRHVTGRLHDSKFRRRRICCLASRSQRHSEGTNHTAQNCANLTRFDRIRRSRALTSDAHSNRKLLVLQLEGGEAAGIRTQDPRLKRPLLYRAELPPPNRKERFILTVRSLFSTSPNLTAGRPEHSLTLHISPDKARRFVTTVVRYSRVRARFVQIGWVTNAPSSCASKPIPVIGVCT